MGFAPPHFWKKKLHYWYGGAGGGHPLVPVTETYKLQTRNPALFTINGIIWGSPDAKKSSFSQSF